MVEVVVEVLADGRIAGRLRRLRLVVGPHCPALVALGLSGHVYAAMGRVHHTHGALRIMVDDLDNLHSTAARISILLES